MGEPNKKQLRFARKLLCGVFLAVLAGLFGYWWYAGGGETGAGRYSAAVSVVLFGAVGLRFLAGWTESWFVPQSPLQPLPKQERRTGLWVFFCFLLADIAMLVLVYLLRQAAGSQDSFLQSLSFWTCLDSSHYLDIARDGYLSYGSWDRLVQLVFLPGYPALVALVAKCGIPHLYAGLLVSGICFAAGGWVYWRLLRLYFDRAFTLRVLKYCCIWPGAFFFAAPMSESVFWLCCGLCLYAAATRHWFFCGLLGAFASFTRTPGLALVVPAGLELFHFVLHETGKSSPKQKIKAFLCRLPCLLFMLLGFAGYCAINWAVAQNPFQFLQYQSMHWGQRLGLFFNTASYQLLQAVFSFSQDRPAFWGLWGANLAAIFGSLILVLCSAKKCRSAGWAGFWPTTLWWWDPPGCSVRRATFWFCCRYRLPRPRFAKPKSRTFLAPRYAWQFRFCICWPLCCAGRFGNAAPFLKIQNFQRPNTLKSPAALAALAAL